MTLKEYFQKKVLKVAKFSRSGRTNWGLRATFLFLVVCDAARSFPRGIAHRSLAKRTMSAGCFFSGMLKVLQRSSAFLFCRARKKTFFFTGAETLWGSVIRIKKKAEPTDHTSKIGFDIAKNGPSKVPSSKRKWLTGNTVFFS